MAKSAKKADLKAVKRANRIINDQIRPMLENPPPRHKQFLKPLQNDGYI